jgi:hypothetical protein
VFQVAWHELVVISTHDIQNKRKVLKTEPKSFFSTAAILPIPDEKNGLVEIQALPNNNVSE